MRTAVGNSGLERGRLRAGLRAGEHRLTHAAEAGRGLTHGGKGVWGSLDAVEGTPGMFVFI